MDQRTTSRRSFLTLARRPPASPARPGRLRQLGTDQSHELGSAGRRRRPRRRRGDLLVPHRPAPGGASARRTVDRFNAANPKTQIKATLFQNDAYKTKIKTALGAGQAPTIIWGWGGGGLKSYVDASQVDDLTSWFDENPASRTSSSRRPSAPPRSTARSTRCPPRRSRRSSCTTTRRCFEKAGVQPPQSWDDILDLVPKFNAKGIAPFSLGGQSRWTNMMWLEFLFDRIGGPEVFQAVFDGEKDAWSNPASIQALTEMQKLVKANGFIKGFSSITADSNADQALLYTGKAAMMLHGAWTYGSDEERRRRLRHRRPPRLDELPAGRRRQGRPERHRRQPGAVPLDLVQGQPDAEKETAKKFFTTGVLADDRGQRRGSSTGNVPIVKGADSQHRPGDDAEWLKFIYDTSSQAPRSSRSRGTRRCSPTAAEVLLDNIAKLFQLSITPEQFATNMNAVIGQ